MQSNPKVLISGHSFVCRFKTYVSKAGHKRFKRDINLSHSAQVFFQGVGGRTMEKLNAFDLDMFGRKKPGIVILDISSNSLCHPGVNPRL